MRVLVMFTVDTADYGEKEFKREIESLVKEIDPESRVDEFSMSKMPRKFSLLNVQITRGQDDERTENVQY